MTSRRDSKIVVWKSKAKMTRGHVIRSLRKALENRVEKAFLFGSYARGAATASSDVDLILVADTERSWASRGKDFLDLFDICGALDLIVYTSKEWKELNRYPTDFLRDARRTWREIL